MSKHGQKHDLDRQNWMAYANFKLMYENFGSEMLEAGVAKTLDEPFWISETGEWCSKEKSHGFLVSYDVTNPDYFIVDNELSGNTS